MSKIKLINVKSLFIKSPPLSKDNRWPIATTLPHFRLRPKTVPGKVKEEISELRREVQKVSVQKCGEYQL